MVTLVVGIVALVLILVAIRLITLARILAFLRAAALWVRYAYFLRFSILLLAFAPVLCIANKIDQTLTSGILVPEFWEQYLCVGFFLVSAAFCALILARVVLINGPERWDQGYNENNDARPPCLAEFLDNNKGEHEIACLLSAQIPNALVFLYLIVNGCFQGVSLWQTVSGLAAGTVLAYFFWMLANAFYYLTFVPRPLKKPLGTYTLGKNAARTILFPRAWFRLNRVGADFPGDPSIEGASTILPKWMVRVGDWAVLLQGYGCGHDEDFYVYEAHYFAGIVLAAFLILYATIWPLAAPVPAPVFSWIAIGLVVLLGVLALVVFWTAKPEEKGRLTRIQILLTAGVVVFVGAVITLYLCGAPERFPILATVLILIIALCWFLGGIAFFLDRYRVPVITAIIVAMILPRMVHLDRGFRWDGGLQYGTGQEEHYLSTKTATAGAEPATPAAILAARYDPADQEPLIVVTSTGGGLHASAWTAAVLAHLESDLGNGALHKRMLLASTVSGGSIGLLTYLRELNEGTLDTNPAFAYQRMQSAAQCSSLESVGWGLVYYDLPKAFVPVIPYFIAPSPGDDDLDTNRTWETPLLKDRTWSLRKSLGRNLRNKYCNGLWSSDTGAPRGWDEQGRGSSADEGLTLRGLAPAGAGGTVAPAFTMNTTTVEDGERFLLANYDVPELLLDSGQNYRALSFLGRFGGTAPKFADLPLATAAQMSATFPYVSSAARVPMDVDDFIGSMHFVDGGYYDNDGTASAIEFLRYALAPPGVPGASAEERARLSGVASKIGKGEHPVRVLLIEIRNSTDDSGTGPEQAGDHSGDKTPWNALSQIAGPPTAFWQAGHGSVTARNRTDLALLEHQLSGKLEVHSVIFADARTKDATGTDPLNWSLTPAQRKEVQQTARTDSFILKQYADAKEWFDRTAAQWCGHGDSEDPAAVCAVKEEAKKTAHTAKRR